MPHNFDVVIWYYLKPEDEKMNGNQFQMIFAIVEAGRASNILEAARNVGAEGGTIILGRGSGIHEHEKIWGVPIEPEKEIIMVMAKKECVDIILDAMVNAGELNKPGKGIAFVMEVSKVAGITHLEDGTCSIGDIYSKPKK